MERFLLHRREPFEIAFLVLILLSCTAQLAAGAVPGSVAALMPSWMHITWMALMAFGSLVALLGISSRNIVDGVYLEHVGITATGLTLAMYGTAQIMFGGLSALLAAGITFALTGAFAVRWRELRRVIKKLPRR